MEDDDSSNVNNTEFETNDQMSIIDGGRLMPKLDMNDVSSPDQIQKMIENFLSNFADRYPGPGPTPYIGPFDEALKNSLFDTTTPCPLILYIHHDQSIAVNIFCRYVLCDEMITQFLAEQFLVWTWDRTLENNHSALVSMLFQFTTKEVTTTITSFPVDAYPLLVCLSVHQDQIDIVSVIKGSMTRDETLVELSESRKKFDCRTELPHSKMSLTNLVLNKNASIPTSVLTLLAERISIIDRITEDFEKSYMEIVRIEQVENATKLTQYLEQKKIIDNRLGHNQSEQFLFHGCSRSSAEGIVQYGFDHKLIGTHGAAHGYGFYFPSNHSVSHAYSIPDILSNNEMTMIVCRVLVGLTCPGSSRMRTCPTGYDSTTAGSDIHILYSNCQILPVYVITYKNKINPYGDEFARYNRYPTKTGFCNIS